MGWEGARVCEAEGGVSLSPLGTVSPRQWHQAGSSPAPTGRPGDGPVFDCQVVLLSVQFATVLLPLAAGINYHEFHCKATHFFFLIFQFRQSEV